MVVDVSAADPAHEEVAVDAPPRDHAVVEVEQRVLGGGTVSVLPALFSVPDDRSKKRTKPAKQSRTPTKPTTPTTNNRSRAPTPTLLTTNNRSRAPTQTLPPLANAHPTHQQPPTTDAKRQVPSTPIPTPAPALPPARVKLITCEPTYNSTFPCKLTSLQITALLKPFWADLLANQLKAVRKHLTDHHLKKLDFNATAVRYAANADATPLHLCAQYGLLAMAKMLVGEFGLAATLRNKVGSTPLHVACKMGKREVVAWLVDELHVPLDVPDAQLRTALDVAPFDTVDKCVLAPLQRQLAVLRQHETELLALNSEAQERLDAAQLRFRQSAMALSDTESHADEERARIEAVSAVARHWHEQWQARRAVLDDLVAEVDHRQHELVREEQEAQKLYEQDVKTVHDEHTRTQSEREQLEMSVDTAQRELDRRRQLLVDQLGVFDASLREFGGSKDVQLWAIATLLAIAQDDGTGETVPDKVGRAELLLRAEPVEVVCHVLTMFPTDYKLQNEALELLVAVIRLYASDNGQTTTSELLITAVADSDLLVRLGDVLARWSGETKAAHLPNIVPTAFEALYLCLGLRQNPQRVLVFCQHKPAQLTALNVIESVGSREIDASREPRCVLCHASLVLLTQTKYGARKALMKAGVVRILFGVVQGMLLDEISETEDETAMILMAETAQYIFAALALLVTSSSACGDDAKQNRRGKYREPGRLEDLTPDAENVRASVIIDCLHKHLLPIADDRRSLKATLWAFKLLINLTDHGGETAFRVRQEMLVEASAPNERDPFSVVLSGIMLALHRNGSDQHLPSDSAYQVVRAGLDLVRRVWVERFDHEGRILPTRLVVVKSIMEITSAFIEQVLVPRSGNTSDGLLHLATALDALRSAARNPQNAAYLIMAESPIEVGILKPILHWTLRYVEENGTSYQEPNLVALLGRVLKIFLLLTQARRLAASEFLLTASPSELAGFSRALHSQSRDLGVCAVLLLFQSVQSVDAIDVAATPEWISLCALCTQITVLTHCSCL